MAGDDGRAAAQLIGVGEVLDALAQTSHGPTRTPLRDAARHFERATRSPIHPRNQEMHALRRAAGQIVHSGTALLHGSDAAATALILHVLIAAVLAAARWHTTHSHAQQTDAAQRTVHHLRTAYQHTASGPLADLRTHGQHLAPAVRQRHTTTIRTVLPHLADRLQAEPGWNALVAALDRMEHSGHDAATLLAKAAAPRELHSAESASDVLVWRLHHLGYVTAPPRHRKPRPLRPPAALRPEPTRPRRR